MLCDFGCGKESIIKFNTGRYCCSLSAKKCESVREKISKKSLEKWKDPLYRDGLVKLHTGKKQSKECIEKRMTKNKSKLNETIIKFKNTTRLTLKKLKERHPILLKEEHIIEVNEKIYVQCKNCEKMFEPKSRQIERRSRSLEHKEKFGVGNSYFFCSKECKKDSLLYHKKSKFDFETINELIKYRLKVLRYTNNSVKNHYDKIPNINLRGNEFHLDHKFSIFEGFKQNIDPKIIGHYKNLEIINVTNNLKKKTRCSTTIENLKSEIEKEGLK